jgi:hypothetical protein
MTERCDGNFGSVLVVAVSSGMLTVEQACHLYHLTEGDPWP